LRYDTTTLNYEEPVKVLRVRPGWDTIYIYHYLRSRQMPNAGYSRHFKFLKEVRFPRPPLDEQRRIAAILDRADALRSKRRQVLAHLDGLTQSIFRDMFDAGEAGAVPLGEVASVSSGITKGRKLNEQSTRTVPYLAVSNVQDGHLNMAVVKEIGATDLEIGKYALADGDLVLTEGGDPDKLGRGTVWRSELPLCLHQNHIFRVRLPECGPLLPDYLSAFLGGRSARAYFLRSAKQTTGIASINMTQLRRLPVQVPPLDEQHEFIRRCRAAQDVAAATTSSTASLDELFTSLQARAFSGRL